MSIKARQMMVATNKYSIKCPNIMDAKYITVHNTAMDASAINEISYMIRNNAQISYHFAIDDKEVVQGLPLNRNGWHAGDSNGEGNRKSIGIEICYSKSGGERYKKAETLTIKFIAQLLKERGWGIDRVRSHKSWTEIGVKNGNSSYVKNCPHRIFDEGRWNTFLNAIKAELTPKVVESKPVDKVQPVKKDVHTVVKGDTLWGISQKYGVSVDTIKKLNKLTNDVIGIGEKINLKDSKPVVSKPKEEVKPTVKPVALGEAIITFKDGLNIRSSANLTSSVVGSALKNQKFPVYEIKNEMYRIADGKWISNKGGKYAKYTPAKKANPNTEAKNNGIKSVGKIKIVKVSKSAIVMDKPDRNNSKNIGSLAKGKIVDISGSVKGKNNPDGYWEVIYKGKRAYISGQFGQRV